MLEGKIIKFYREFQGIKQKDLGEGICSSTHISKIERGLTEVSDETIHLLSQRLGINMESEMSNYRKIELLLKEWLDAIIKKLQTKADSIKKQLDGINLLHIQDFYRSYTLILTRYYLSIGDARSVEGLMEEMSVWEDLSHYEKNMFLHVKGIYYLSMKHDYVNAITFLHQIDLKHYSNQEYYYDLALAYHSLNSRVLAFFNANKALQFFTEIRSFSRIIETEMLMLIQLEQSEDYPTLSGEYQRLIEMTEDYGLQHQKAVLHHNLAYLYLRNGKYKQASEYYKNSMDARDQTDPRYLGSLEGYVNALAKEGKTSKEKLLELVELGLRLSKKMSDSTFLHFFTMHYYYLSEQEEKYYEYLEEAAYPHFEKKGYVLPAEHYAVKLFDYYMEKNEIEKANRLAGPIINKFRRNNQFV
jgi:transcriptional regulator with XRE-family HTH domain